MNLTTLNLLTKVLGNSIPPEALLGIIVAIIYFAIYMFILLIIIALAVAAYVLQGIGLTRMLRSVGYAHPWHAWVPYANSYAIGALADKYDDGKEKTNYAKTLLGLQIAMSIISVVIFGFAYPLMLVGALAQLYPIMIIGYIMIYALLIPFEIISIICAIKIYFAQWRIFRIFHPELSVLYILLSIFASSYAASIILFIIRNREPQNLRIDASAELYTADIANDSENPYFYE